MKLQINTVHFDADPTLLNFVERKVNKLETFFDQIVEGEVYLRNENNSNNQEDKLVELKINVPGHTLFAKEQKHSFEEGTDAAVEAMRRQLLKLKDKMTTR